MLYKELGYRKILEGFVKVNFLFLICLPIILYFSFFSIRDYFALMKWQFLGWILSISCAKLYERFRFNSHSKRHDLYNSSIYVGVVIASALLYGISILFFHKLEDIEILGIFVILSLGWAFYIFVVLTFGELVSLKWYIKLLDKNLSYKNILQIFFLFNISLGGVIFLFATINDKYSLVESLFLLLYMEISFFVFHIVVAKFVDFIWHNADLRAERVSLFGLIIASVIYGIKIRIMEERFFGVFEDLYINDNKVFALIIMLSLFWIFFSILFNFNIRRAGRS